ncbi:MAG TPA: YIP1 family protein [Thermohalobaculum sp.]|nr:YIP1 family protein [Thermohalobaculum sp.]
MIGALVQNVVGGFLQPRTSVRRIIDGGHGFDAALLMALLALLVREMFIVLFSGVQTDASGLQLGAHVLALIEGLVSFAVLSAVVYGAGRMFRGTGTWRETLLAMAWYLLVTSVLVPLALPALVHLTDAVKAADGGPVGAVDIPGNLLTMFAVASGIMLWLFACYVAELHRFARTWNVVAVMLGLSVAFSFILMALVPSP